MPRENLNPLLTGNFAGVTLEDVLSCKPEIWQRLDSKKGPQKGLRLVDENETERVRFMYPTPEYPHGYWIRKSECGHFYLDESGAKIKGITVPGEHKRIRHIPYTGGDEP